MTRNRTRAATSSGEPVRPSTIRKEIGHDVEAIVLKCLSKEPHRRYQTAGELGRDIERELEALKAELAPLGWGGMDDQLLLNVLKAHWRLNVLDTQPRKLFDKFKADGYEKTLETLQRSVHWAIDELATIGVRGPCALPYANQLIALADAA